MISVSRPSTNFCGFELSPAQTTRAHVPKDLDLKVGMMLIFKREDEMRIPGIVADIKADTIKVDFNHPLSGKTLNFKIKLVDIK